jgi:hypothetical protein
VAHFPLVLGVLRRLEVATVIDCLLPPHPAHVFSCFLRGAAHVVVCSTGWAVALALLLTSYSAAAPVTLVWEASSSMVDGYWLYYGTQSGTYTARIDVGTATVCTLELTSGETYYFAATAYDRTEHVESAFSNEASTTLPPNQPPPAGGGQKLSGGDGGCTINPGAGFDPVVMGITAFWLVSLVWKRAKKRPGELRQMHI